MAGANLQMQSTRQQMLEYLQRSGRATVKELGQLLGLTATGIRQHLTVLERDGLVDAREERGRVGRPTLVYSLTEKADSLFPKTYDVLASVLLDLSTTAQINDSMKLAKAVLGEIGGINRLHKGAVEQAGFAVLKAPDIPSILIETAFISNPDEEARLTDEAYQEQMADAVLKGIKKYFAKNPPLAKNRMT